MLISKYIALTIIHTKEYILLAIIHTYKYILSTIMLASQYIISTIKKSYAYFKVIYRYDNDAYCILLQHDAPGESTCDG